MCGHLVTNASFGTVLIDSVFSSINLTMSLKRWCSGRSPDRKVKLNWRVTDHKDHSQPFDVQLKNLNAIKHCRCIKCKIATALPLAEKVIEIDSSRMQMKLLMPHHTHFQSIGVKIKKPEIVKCVFPICNSGNNDENRTKGKFHIKTNAWESFVCMKTRNRWNISWIKQMMFIKMIVEYKRGKIDSWRFAKKIVILITYTHQPQSQVKSGIQRDN